MEQDSADKTEEEAKVEFKPSGSLANKLPGKLIIEYLQEMQAGATIRDIVQYLSAECGKNSEELMSSVVATLENGTALGFLERKGSHYLNWAAREAGCRRRRRRRSCRRRRRRSCRRRRKKPSCCCCKKKRRRRKC